ncbi:MAG: hypothetical protein KBT05_04395 [Bacteroidales bacterium]|nr:hypothetical protein [Candidatus Cryptobacteroides caccocaballi]
MDEKVNELLRLLNKTIQDLTGEVAELRRGTRNKSSTPTSRQPNFSASLQRLSRNGGSLDLSLFQG